MKTKNFIKQVLSLFLSLVIFMSSIFSCTSALAVDSKYKVPNAGGRPKFFSYEYYTAFGKHNGTRNSAIAYGYKFKGHKYNTKTDSKTGARMCEGCYCVALGTYFSKGAYKGCGIGSKFLITFSSGKKINAIWTDEKADGDTDSSLHIHHKSDGSYLEVVCEKGKLPKKVKNAGSYLPLFGGKMVSVEPIKNAIPGVNDGANSSNDFNSYLDNTCTLTYNPVSELVCKLLGIKVDKNTNAYSTLKKNKSVKTFKKLSTEVVKSGKIQNKKSLKSAKKKLKPSQGIGELDYYDPTIDYSIGGDYPKGLTTGILGPPLKHLNSYTMTAGKPGHPRYSSGDWHAATDYACPTGTHVYAADGGRVVSIKHLSYSYGNHVRIKCVAPNGVTYIMIYAHLERITVREGELVKKGQEIAISDNSGNSSGSHLHFEIQYNGNHHNIVLPSEYMGKQYYDSKGYKVKRYRGQ